MYCNECGARFKKTEEACPKCGKLVSKILEETENENLEVAEDTATDVEAVAEDTKAEITEEKDSLDDFNADENTDAENADAENADSEENLTEDAPKKKGSNVGLIVAIIAVVLVIVLGIFFIFSKNIFSFGKPNVDGIWESDGYYFQFDGDKAKQYKNTEVVQEYDVKYVSKNEIVLITYDEESKSTAEIGVKPVIKQVDGEKQLELFTLYQNVKYEIDDKTEATLSMTKTDKLPEPITYGDDMSKEMREKLYGEWKGKTKGADGEKTDLEMTFDKDSVKYVSDSINDDYTVYYAADDEVVIRIYYADYDYEYYMAYTPTLKGDKLTLTPKYYVQDNKKVDAGEDEEPTVLTKVK
jgi:hypothetical protein